MKSQTLNGKYLKLRAIEDRDRAILVDTERDAEFLRLVGEDELSYEKLGEDDFVSMQNNSLYWAIEFDNACIGVAFLHALNKNDRRAKYAIGIFPQEHWGRGFGEEATNLILSHSFSQLFLHRISVRVLSYNTRAIGCYKKCGFVIEGTQRESALVDGQWYDDVLMGILER